MTRSSFRKLWLLSLGIMLSLTSYAYNSSEELAQDISRAVRTKDRLTLELRKGNELTASLAMLDDRTIDENNATRLNIMRYMGIEETQLAFVPQPAIDNSLGGARVFTREFTIKGSLPYAKALEQLDHFYTSKKVRIDSVRIMPDSIAYGDATSFEMKGVLYGLHK